jgi:Domain of unknown function (DU1801)
MPTPTGAPKDARTPAQYIARLDEPRRSQIRELHALVRATVPTLRPHMQAGMIGYGSYHYRGASGREGDWPVIAVASNARYISLYVMATVGDAYLVETYRDRLPKASIGRSCVRFRRVEDLDRAALTQLLREGAAHAPRSVSSGSRG